MSKKEAAVEQKAEKFTIPKLQKYAFQLFGVPTSTFVGATAGLDGEYTVEEVREKINEWYKKEAK